MSYSWKSNPERLGGLLAITADGWRMTIHASNQHGSSGPFYWQVKEPAPSTSGSGGVSKTLPAAKADVVKALAAGRENRKISDSPERRAKMAAWHADVQKMFDDMPHGPRKP